MVHTFTFKQRLQMLIKELLVGLVVPKPERVQNLTFQIVADLFFSQVFGLSEQI